jgi:hypothetical protein
MQGARSMATLRFHGHFLATALVSGNEFRVTREVIINPFNLESALYECSSDGDFVSSTLKLRVLSQAKGQLPWKTFDLLQEIQIMRECDQFGRRTYGWRTVDLSRFVVGRLVLLLILA